LAASRINYSALAGLDHSGKSPGAEGPGNSSEEDRGSGLTRRPSEGVRKHTLSDRTVHDVRGARPIPVLLVSSIAGLAGYSWA